MKTSTLVGLAALGGIAFFLLKGKKEESFSPGLSANPEIPPIIAQINTEAAQAQAAKEAITQPQSKTVQTGVTAVVGGTSYKGNVAILPGEKEKVFVGAKEADRSGGLTEWDKRILQNKGLAVTTANARKQGLLTKN